MAWGAIATDATWTARMASGVIRPAVFLYLNWPGEAVYASTHTKSITTVDPASTASPPANVTWSGVGNFGFIEADAFGRDGALVTYRVGLTSLPQSAITEATEASAIGERAIVYSGLFDANYENVALQQVFIGHIISAGDFKMKRNKAGEWLVEASVELSNGRSPRRQLQNHHSPETAEATDTAWRLLPTVGHSLTWPS